MWVIQEMLSAKCDLKTTPIGIVPFGTGNDFSRVLGRKQLPIPFFLFFSIMN